MLRLRTLGGLSIEQTDGSGPATGSTSARRRLALLAVLAASETRTVPRDRLLALFWPETDLDRARHSLDQTLYALKRDLGEGALVGRDELSLNPEVITSDIGVLRAALAAGDRAAAVELYTGPFLDGVFLSGAAELERWIEAEREHLARDIERAIESLANESASRGDHDEAARWWRRLAAKDPRKTKVVVALMSSLAASGDRAGALRHAEIYHTLVKDEPDVQPNPAVAELADRIRREPAARPAATVAPFTPPIPAFTSPPAAPLESPPVEHPGGERRRPTAVRRLVVAAAGIAVVALSVAWMVASRKPLPDRAWILPATFTDRAGDPVLGRALDAALTAGLEQSAAVTVFPATRVQQTLKRMGHAGDVPLDEALAREVAQREGVPLVVAGSIDRVGRDYVITARLVDARSGGTRGIERSIASDRGSVIEALDVVVRRVRRRVGESPELLARHDRPLPLVTTRSLEALQKYAEGVAAANTGQRPVAIELWNRAVALDSEFALAHAELGAAYYFGNDPIRGEAHFARALANRDRLTDRERLLVEAGVESWRGNRERAIVLRQTLLAEYPDDPGAWGKLGYDLMRLGRSREAVAALNRQLARDSDDVPSLINLATSYKASGSHDSAIVAYRRAFAIEPTWLMVNNLNHEFGATLVLAGRQSEARAVFDTMRRGNAEQRAQGERSTALLSMLQGRYADATQHFQQAALIGDAPGRELTTARNRLFLAAAERERGRVDSARGELRGAHALFRRAYFEPQFLMYLGKSLARDGQATLAQEVLDTLVRRARPTNPRDRVNVAIVAGEVALARGRADSAVSAFRRAAAVDSGSYVVESLARGLAAAGDPGGAGRIFESLAASPARWFGSEAEPFALAAWRDAGASYERAGERERARLAYERQLAQWAAPDSDLVALRDARSGVARLNRLRLQVERR